MPKPKDSPDFDRNGPGMGPREGGKKGFGGGRPAGGPPMGEASSSLLERGWG